MKRIWMIVVLCLFTYSCAKERPYLTGHIKRAHDAVMVDCDPYNLGATHTCVVFASAFQDCLYVLDASASEIVLSDMAFFPLRVAVGPSTDQLVKIVSDKQMPWMFAVDRATPAFYSVRLFPDADVKSFTEPEKHNLSTTPQHVAAFDAGTHIVMISVFSLEKRIELLAIDKITAAPDQSLKPVSITVGDKPKGIEIDKDRKVAVITDEGQELIHVLDLANINDLLQGASSATISTVDIAMKSDHLYLSRRDFGQGNKLYALIFDASINDIKLVNIDDKKVESSLSFDEHLLSGYFPDQGSATCCGQEKNWLAVASIKGNFTYVTIKPGATLTLEKNNTVELPAEANLQLNKIHVRKIVGGYVVPDPNIKRENLCKTNRQTFFIGSYANSRTYRDTEPVEVDPHGQSCEGENPSRLGQKTH